MTEIDPQRLADLTTSALERTAFMLAEPVEPEDAANLQPVTRTAAISFTGPNSGVVTLSASEGFLRELASSLLGVMPEDIDPESTGCDALRELANIVGGSIILDIGGEDCEYSLGLPTLIDSPVPTDPDACSCTLEAEGERLVVSWSCAAGPSSMAA